MSFYKYKDKEDWKKTSDYGCYTDEINDLRASVKMAGRTIETLRAEKKPIKTSVYEEMYKENQELRECVKFYATTDNWKIPDIDSRGFDGMSAKSIIELEDYDSSIFSSGKRARQCLK